MQTLKLTPTLSAPSLGLGTWKLTGEICTRAVSSAIEIGYRHIDTADAYGNHTQVAAGIKNSGIKRSDLFVTTKVWRDDLHPDDVTAAAARFREELQTDYIDLLLIHWPNADVPVKETFTAMQTLQQKKIIKAFGVSNFTIPYLEEALATKIPFVTNQVEFHPSLNQKELKEFCDANNIIVTAYSPIAQGADLKITVIVELATQYKKTPAQIIINWLLKKNMIVIPRSGKPERIAENWESQSFSITDDDRKKIDDLTLHHRIVRPSFAPFTD